MLVFQLKFFFPDKPRPGKPEKSEEEIGYKTRHQEAGDDVYTKAVIHKQKYK